MATLVFWCAGCGSVQKGSGGSTVRDSAGITIVENQAALLEEGAWSLSDDPILQIGGVDSEPEYEFWEVTQVLLNSAGRILVANRGTHQVRFYDADGTFLSAFGTEGEGPGEFRGFSGVYLTAGDSILVYDGGLGRVSLFDPAGSFAGQTTLPSREIGFPVGVRGALPGRRLILSGGGARSFASGGDTQIVQDSLWYMVGEWGLPRVDTIGRLANDDRYIISTNLFVGIAEPPFARRASTAVHGEGIFYGIGDEYEVRVYGPDGHPRRLIRRTLSPPALTQDLIDRFVYPPVPPGEEPFPPWWAEEADRFDFPPAIPFFDRLLTDSEGHLWVRRVTWPEEGAVAWDIFDPSGIFLTSLLTPSGLEVHDIGADYILGVWKDELEVEYVRMYALVRGGSIR
jgi:hypothetical protein